MNLLKKNIFANIAGSFWQTFIGLVFIPIYIRLLGIESWGLVGIFTTLQVVFGLLYLGFSSTLNRELARLSAIPNKEKEMRNLVHTLEIVYWGIAIFIGIIAVSLSSFMAHHWIKAGQLSPQAIEQALALMGFAVALQLPIGFYSGGLMGLERQVLLNMIIIGTSTARGAGAALLLWLLSPTIQIFFAWQIICSILSIILLSKFLWHQLPASKINAVFDKSILSGIRGFATGMTGITLSAMLLTQIDKMILSKMLTLETFGYYSLASVVSSGIGLMTTSIINAVFPRFSALAAIRDDTSLKQLYNISTQALAIFILPVGLTIASFSYEILFIWTGNSVTAQNTSQLLSILILGTTLNALMYLPYTLQLAYGWTEIGLKICLFLIVLFVPTIIILTKLYGAVGAASAWVILNIIYMGIGVPLTHRRLLKREGRHWFTTTAYTFLCVLVTIWTGRYFLDHFFTTPWGILPLSIVFVCALVSAGVSSPYIRYVVRLKLFKRNFTY